MKSTVITVVVALALLFLAGCDLEEQIGAISIQPVDVSSVADGTYRGSERHFPVTAVVDVEIAGGEIRSIDLVRHFHGPDHGADDILARVLERQNVDVDVVSGATYSSIVVLKAIENALSNDT